MTKKMAVKRAWMINTMLEKVKEKARQLQIEMDVEGINYDSEFASLNQTLEELIGFDLEDSIIYAEWGE